ncbi:unnamed protein product [Adineta steineri]|uniref:Fibronectin type-III domain-containing protein n=2 Tax=Adineta steineri TaxID=433720 RepID=A0A813QCZ1_9BILA|nr:unnamed protein product [Adineta steineri]CAF0922569.1 unnamed protein product [Adineta steineri]
MIVSIILILFLQFIYSTAATANDIANIRYSSLISAQCKARCLYEYRNHHHQQRSVPATFNNEKSKRVLTTHALTLPWRSIWERCPRLITCNSCLLPCDLDPPLLLSNEQSCQAICSTLTNVECQRSCVFIQKLYQQQSNCLTDDCQSTSSCSPLNDCFEKVPQPNNVTAIERKSRRTVRLKWSSNGMTNLEPIFYVIEAQWTLPKSDMNQQDTVSKWGFVKEEVSHTKAIIRNIQRDNRWYTFRVAAVTRHGYSPFSTTTKPFRLSSNSKNNSQNSFTTIASPKNLIVKDFQTESNTKLNVTLQWEKPDFLVHGYQISWEGENDSASFVNTVDVSSALYPLELTIPFLSMHTSYIFKIRSLIIPDGDLIQMSAPISIKFNYDDELFSIKNFHISEPYFINGLIKTNITWNKINDYRIQQYDLHWIETQCYSDVLSCCYRRDAFTIENSFELYDLRFNCTYVLNIKPVIPKIRIQKPFQVHFNVSSCQSIHIFGTIRPSCQIDDKQTMSSLSPLNLIVTRNESGIQFYWQNIHSLSNDGTDIVYRLRIEQLPSHIELISIDLLPTITNYFLPYSNQQEDQYLNVTLTLLENMTVRQQKSLLIENYQNNYRTNRNLPLNIVSLSTRIQMKFYLIIILFISIDLIRR